MHIDELDTPALWADLDIVERNISRMGEYCKQIIRAYEAFRLH